MILQIVTEGTLFADQTALNVFHLDRNGNLGVGEYAAAEADISAWLTDMYDEMLGSLHDDYTIGSYVVSSVDLPTGTVTELFTAAYSWTGGINLEELPNQVSGSVYIGVTGTNRKARKSIAGVAGVHVSGNLWNAVGLDNLLDFAQQWTDGPGFVAGAAATTVMWSRLNQIVHDADGMVAANVVVGSADTRKPGVGA